MSKKTYAKPELVKKDKLSQVTAVNGGSLIINGAG
ncbi:MAG: putative RiPP precursor [Mesorhizobium sp.]|nr:putative RiPP precursor [Mesorhizobium sp.]RVC61169.1 putative RiPP precursor [Mesorhizobium sp. M4B.F.Ca.ET.088.02.2.1]RWF28275.1 MAG: putative RiPP precursor [Mesorhizobium sp.]RWF38587.1 MAG: putative RiPP precursor [Mesorhizobium sp.]TIX12597.1 MAG: putative RiPP precursor [Mesorhizobium sp.]TIX42370.1 MAG: putative RiPP precursor [Mesorhizobium sp.]